MSQSGPNGNDQTVATTYVTDSGIAVPAGNVLDILGGTGVTTSGSGNTIIIDASAAVGVTSLTATAPLTANGLSGSAQTGAVTIAIPIPLSGANGGTGVANTGLTINLSGGAVGKYLASDISGNASWAPLSSSAVTSISGTANQINTSSSTGAVTLSLSSTLILPGTLQLGGNVNGDGYDISNVFNYTGANGGNSTLRTNTSINDNLVLQAYDVDGTSYISFITLTAGNTPTCVIENNSTWNGNVIGLTYGGTNANLTASNGGIVYSNATQLAILAGTATAGQILRSGSSSAPSWSTATYPSTTTINQILYSSSNNVIGGIVASNNGVLISGTTGIPSWLAAGTTGQVLIATTSNPPSWGTLSSIAVTSITGTANQISASASIGAVTLSLTNGISIGSYQATSPPTGGIICPGNVGIGTTALTNKLDVNGSVAIGTYAGVTAAPTNGALISGNVGIGAGITTPPSLLYLASGTPRLTMLDTDAAISASNPSWTVRAQDDGVFRIQSSPDNAAFTTRFAIDPNGSVMVNSTSTSSASMFYVVPSITASGGAVRGFKLADGTLTAAANSNGLRVQEISGITFAKGAFTGLSVSMLDIFCNSSTATGAGTIDNAYALRILDNFSLTATSKWSFYNGSTDQSYFAGKVSLASSTADANHELTINTTSLSGLTILSASGSGATARSVTFGVSSGVSGSPQLLMYPTANTAAQPYAIQAARSGVASDATLSLNPSGGGVTIGTTSVSVNKLDVSGSAAIGSYAAVNTAPTNGLIVSGNVGIGCTSTDSTITLDVQVSSGPCRVNSTGYGTGNNAGRFVLRQARGTQSSFTATQSADNLGLILFTGASDTNTFASISSCSMFAVATENWTPTAIGADLRFGVTATGTASRTDVLKIAQNGCLCVGSSYVSSTGVSNGSIIFGQVGIGTSIPDSNCKIQSVSTNSYNLYLTGSQTAQDAFSQQNTLYVNSTMIPTNSITLVAGIQSAPLISAASTKTISFACGMYINPTTQTNVGTITSYLGLYLGAGDLTTTGTITSAYNLYISQPFASSTGNYYAMSCQGGEVHFRRAVSGDTTVTTKDFIIGVTSTAAARTITLPATAPDAGWFCIVKDESGGAAANNITIARNGRTINGAAANLTINTNYGNFRIYSDGANYFTW